MDWPKSEELVAYPSHIIYNTKQQLYIYTVNIIPAACHHVPPMLLALCIDMSIHMSFHATPVSGHHSVVYYPKTLMLSTWDKNN